jgi:hydroxyacylglutathione hydrolase
MNLTAVPAFNDNYIWMSDDGRSTIVVDPGQAGPVHAHDDARRLALAAILVTHPRADHCRDVDGLRAAHDTAASNGSEALAAIRAWKNEFR